jgi:hypothetical protein
METRIIFLKNIEDDNEKFLNQLGQSTVEYILLLAVISFVTTSLFNSSMFKDYFGEDGTFVTTYKYELEYSYRHGVRGRKKTVVNYASPNHDSYKSGGNTRFFGALLPYPQN